jgi:hypothetical protein
MDTKDPVGHKGSVVKWLIHGMAYCRLSTYDLTRLSNLSAKIFNSMGKISSINIYGEFIPISRN